MARYDLPTYVLYVSGDFWMFAVQKTECVFSLKSLGLLIECLGQTPKKNVFSGVFANSSFKSKYLDISMPATISRVN